MKKIIASSILLFAMLTSLNATEAPMHMKMDMKDSNCTSKMKCKTEKKADCAVPCKIKDCTKCDKGASHKSSPTWSNSADANTSMRKLSCCKGKKKEASDEKTKEEKTTKEEAPMKCAGGGK